MVSAGWLVEADWTNTGTWVDITTYVKGFSGSRGRQRPVDQVSPGTLSLDLYNEGGRFTPGNTSGAYYPNVKVNRQIRVSVNPSGTQTYLFTGRIDTVSAAWTNGVRPMVTVTLTDGFKGLARRTSQAFYNETVIVAGASAFYPLTEPSGSTTFADVSPASVLPLAQLNVSKFGAGTFTAGNGAGYQNGAPQNTYCTFAHTGTGNTEGMTVVQLAGGGVKNGPAVVGGTTPWTWGCWFNIPAVPADRHMLLYARTPPFGDPSLSLAFPNEQFSLYMDAAGKINFSITDNIHNVVVTATSSTSYANQGWCYVTATLAADNKTLSLFVNGSTATTVAGVALTLRPASWIVAGGMLSPWGESAYGLNGSLANIDIYPKADDGTSNSIRWLFGRDGYYLGNATSDQFQNVAQNYGYKTLASPFVVISTGNTAHIANFDMSGMTYLSILQRIADTEQGLAYCDGAGSLIFKNRSYRVNQASAFTLSAATQDVAADFVNAVDDSLLFNDYAATRPNGAVVRVRDTTSTSIADNGVYTNAPDANGAQQVYYTTDGEVTDYAAYIVAQYSQPQPRAPKITVDLLRGSSLWSTVQAVELGMRFTVTNLPPEASASSMDLIVESIAWSVDIPGDTVTLSMDTSPADTVMYMTLDDAKYGLLDSNSLYF